MGVTGVGCATTVGSGAVPDTAGSMLEARLVPEPPSAVPREARLLGGCVGVYPSLGRWMRRSLVPLCSSVNRLMTANCSSGALYGIWPITMYHCVRKLM